MDQDKEIVFYDGECGFCSNSVQFILSYERDNSLLFCPLQSNFARDLLASQNIQINLDTMYVYSKGKVFSRSLAIKTVCKHFKSPYSWLSVLISITPRFLADSVYNFVAKNRYSLQGKIAQWDDALQHTQDKESIP